MKPTRSQMKHLGPRSSSGCLQEGQENCRRGAVLQKGEPSSSSGAAPGRTGSRRGNCAPWVLPQCWGRGDARPRCPGRTPPHLTRPQEKVTDESFSREEQSQLRRPTFLRLNSAGTVTSICFLSYIKRSYLPILHHQVHVQVQDSGIFAQA